MLERRKFDRHTCKLEYVSPDKNEKGQVVDISKNGAKIQYSYEIDPDESNDIMIMMPENSAGHDKILVNCKIRWNSVENGTKTAGVEFMFLEIQEMMALNYLISIINSENSVA